jgi:hypothetical protein
MARKREEVNMGKINEAKKWLKRQGTRKYERKRSSWQTSLKKWLFRLSSTVNEFNSGNFRSK